MIELISRTKPALIGLVETKKEQIADSFLKSLVGHRLFSWKTLPAKGSARGILVGVDTICEILSWQVGLFSISCHIKVKALGVNLRLLLSMAPPMRRRKTISSLNYIVCL